MKKKILLIPLALLLVMSLVAIGCPAPAPAPAPPPTPPAPVVEPEYQWGIAYAYAVKSSYGRQHQVLSDLIEQYSDGRIEMTAFPGGARGTAYEVIEAIQTGDLEMGYTYHYGTFHPHLDVGLLPFLLETRAQNKYLAFQAYDGIVWHIISDAWEEIGVKYVSASYNRTESLATVDGPIRTPDDLKGMKIRAYSPILIEAVERMGAVVATLAGGEVYTALQTGTIDGTIADPVYMMDARYHEVAKHLGDINLYMASGGMSMNLELYNSLPDDLKEAIDRAGYDTELLLLQQCDIDWWEAEETLKGYGVTITYLTDEERQAFRDIVKPEELWHKYFTEILGADALASLIAEAARIKAQY